MDFAGYFCDIYLIIFKYDECICPSLKNYLECTKLNLQCTLKPVLSSHLKIGKAKIFMTDGSLLKVESIEECSLEGSILQYF